MTRLLTWALGRLPIGWLQLMHNRSRLLSAVGGVTFANVLVFMQLGFMSALFETGVLFQRSLNADIVLLSADFQSLRDVSPLPRVRLHQALSHPRVVDATSIYLTNLGWTDSTTGDKTNFRAIGVDPNYEVFVDTELNRKLRLLVECDSAIVDRKARDFNSAIEATVKSNGTYSVDINSRAISFVDLFSQGASFEVDGSLIVSEQTFFQLTPKNPIGAPTIILVKLDRPEGAAQVAAELNKMFPERDTIAYTKSQWIATEQNFQATQTPIGFVFGFGVVIGMVVGLVIVYQVLTTDVQDHLAEYATFKAIGYPKRYFVGIIFEESICLATMGFFPGLLIALGLYWLASNKIDLPISMTSARLISVLIATITTCMISGYLATKRLNAADPAELF